MAGSSPTVSKRSHPDVANHPDAAPYVPKLGDPTGKFEGVDPRKARGGKNAGSKHGGAPDGSGQAATQSFAAMRGHLDHSAQFGQLSGNAPKRSSGKGTPSARAMVKKGLE